MKKVNLFKKCMMLCYLSLSIAAHAQQPNIRLQFSGIPSPDEVSELVKSSLPNTLQLIEPDDLTQYGFASTDNFESITIGLPFYQTLLQPEMFTRSEIDATPVSILVPLILQSRARCLVHIGYEDNAWRVVGIGDGLLVKQQAEIFSDKTNLESDRNILFFAPNQNQNYLLVEGAEYGFKPLYTFDQQANKLMTWKDVVALQSSSPKETESLLHELDETEINQTK